MKTLKTMVVVLGVAALTAAVATGDRPDCPDRVQRGLGGRGGPEGVGGPRLAMMLENERAIEKLGLTGDQVAALKARLAEAEKTMIKLRADVELAEAEVRNLMRANTVDRAAVMKAVEAAGAAHLALRKAVIEERLAFREIAGAEAVKKVRHHLAQRRDDGAGPGERRGSRADRRGPSPSDAGEE